MRSRPSIPIVKDLVLIGGGHSHVEVLRSFGMAPVPGARLTLITKDIHTPYSGMLPGYVSGFYTWDDVHIDLSKLATFAGARLIHSEAIGIDPEQRIVKLRDRPSIQFDALSINTGITPAKGSGSKDVATPVKPIATFVVRFEQLLKRVQEVDRSLTIVIVGGGAGGVELALSLNYRLESLMKELGQSNQRRVKIRLVTQGKILSTHIPYMRSSFLKICKERGVQILEGKSVVEAKAGKLVVDGGEIIDFDECLWCTQASAAEWLRSTGLKTDGQGFLLIDEFLQCVGAPPGIFAAGDVATSICDPRPKAGVFAVRQGPPIASNLRRFLLDEPLEPFHPQTTFLSLISTGNRYCVGSKGKVGWQSGWLWTLKDQIDRKFMYKYGRDLPDMSNGMLEGPHLDEIAGGDSSAPVVEEARMRCGGCGGKVGWPIVQRSLSRISATNGSNQRPLPVEDCAIVKPPPPGHVHLQTVDFLTAFITDPYLFGSITANHCLSDVYAMGGKPETALAIAVLPFSSDPKMEDDMKQVMRGVVDALAKDSCHLVGGHSCEGADQALGLNIQGVAREDAILFKSGMQPGQDLILTKPLGTGTLLAALMRGKAKGHWITKATDMMLMSNAAASQILCSFGATSCTDVTGFGLLGHLGEMVEASEVGVVVSVECVPSLEGAQECLELEIYSSIFRHNKSISSSCEEQSWVLNSWRWPLMLDPQTSGGLLATVPSENTSQCVEALRQAGYPVATRIGTVTDAPNQDQAPIKFKGRSE